jgi:hypothetical protein
MSDPTKVCIVARVPTELVQDLMQHVRDFDKAHAGCHFEIYAATNMTMEEVNTILDSIDPPLPIRQTVRKQ